MPGTAFYKFAAKYASEDLFVGTTASIGGTLTAGLRLQEVI